MYHTYILQNDYHSKVPPSPHINIYILVRTFKIYSLSNFQVYNTLLLAIMTTLYMRSPGLTHIITGSLYPMTNSFCALRHNALGKCTMNLRQPGTKE